MHGIERYLPNNSYLAAHPDNANNPSAANPFATIADVAAVNTIYNADDSIATDRVVSGDGTKSLTFDQMANYTVNVTSPTKATHNWADGALGATAVHGTGLSPTGFEAAGGVGSWVTAPGTKGYSASYDFGGNVFIQHTVYDSAFSTDESGFIAGQVVAGGNNTYMQIYHWDYLTGNYHGFEVNVFGERVMSQSAGLNRLSALGAANGIAFLSGAGATGYIGVADQDGLIDWFNNSSYGVTGWGGIYNGSGTTQAGVTTVTIPTGGSILFDGDFAGTLFQIDGDTGKITIGGLLDPSGLQVAPQAANPGDAFTFWSNSSDANNPYFGPDRLARYSELIADDQTWADTLVLGNTSSGNDVIMTVDDVIVSSITDRGYLNLHNGGEYEVTLFNDGNNWNESGLYLTQQYLSLFADGWSSAYQAGNNYLQAYAGQATLNMRGDISVFFTNTRGINIIDHSTQAFTSNAFGGETGPSVGVIVNASASTLASNTGVGIISRDNVIVGGTGHNIAADIDGTVILGGQLQNASKSYSAYVTQLVNYNPGLGGFDTVLQFAGATGSDQTQTFQNASGTIALLSDIPATPDTFYSADGTILGTRTVTVNANDIVFNGGGQGLIIDADNYTIASYLPILGAPQGRLDLGGLLSGARTWQMPNQSGTVALVGDINDSLYTADGNIVGNRTVTGDENLLLFQTTNFRAITGDGAYVEAIFDEVNLYGGGGIRAKSNLRLAQAATAQQRLYFDDLGGTPFSGYLQNADLTAARVWTLPDADGTISLQDIYTSDGTLTGARTVNMGTNQLTFNNGDLLVESVGGNDYIAMISNQVVLGAIGHVWIDTGRLELSGPYSGGNDPEVVFNQTSFSGVLGAVDLSAARTWDLPDASGEIALAGAYDTGQVYTPSNVTTVRTFDADATTIDTVADVLGTLIADLQSNNILS